MRAHVVGVLLSLIAAVPAFARKAPPLSEGAIAWQTGYHQGLTEAKAKGTPILVRIEPRSRCEPCRDMEWRVWSHPDVVELSRQFTAIRMDTAVYQHLLNRLRVREVPTMLVLSSDGQELHRLRGYTTAPLLIKTLQQTLTGP